MRRLGGSVIDLDLDGFNPYPSFQPGQAEAITEILNLYEAGEKVVELNAPTASGKSLELYVLGRVLTEELGIGRTVYTTPLVALVNQLQDTSAFTKMPVLKGKRNYPCPFLQRALDNDWSSAEDCPFETWTNAKESESGVYCVKCPYQIARNKFMAVDFGAATLARYQVDPGIRNETVALLVDESAGLEKTLIDRATLVLPDEVDLDDLVPSLTVYHHELALQIKVLAEEIRDTPVLRRKTELIRQKNRLERESRKCVKVLAHLEKKHPYIIDKDRQFRLLFGRSEFVDMIESLEFIVLASGTPNTPILTEDFIQVLIQHPIPVERRICYYWPIGSMNYKERQATAPKMAEAIAKLHQDHGRKKTMVHCGAYVIAKMLFEKMPAAVKRKSILQEQDDREGSKNKFLEAKEAVFLSVNFEEGLDLKGPDYPLNIIAKVPFENISDEFVKSRNEHDNYKRYNMHAAVAVMQAAGRCTRSIDDFSKTYILDASWQGFFNRCRKLFQPWFLAALKRHNEMSLEAWQQ